MRRERSNKLGTNQQNGIFPSIGANLDLKQFLPTAGMAGLNLRVGYGVTGSIPTEPRLALDLYDYSFNEGGTLIKLRDANPDLRWEQKSEINFGLDFSINQLFGSLDFYRRNISDIILQRNVDTQVYPSGSRFENAAGLKGGGLELTLTYTSGSANNLLWQHFLVLSTNRMKLERYPIDKALVGFPDGVCGCSTQFVLLEKGREVGNLWGPVFDRVDASGNPIFKDINQDGQLRTIWNYALDPSGDFTTLGNAFPDLEVGWGNKLSFGNWELNAFFRAAVGHSLLNTLRMGYEAIDAGTINSYNRVQTDKSVDNLSSALYSSLYVEKASFFMLDNITLTYTLPFKTESKLRSMKVFTTIQNALTITSYTGINPEPRLVDYLPSGGAYSIPFNALVPGIDRNSAYYPVRTFMIGLSAII